MNPKLKFDIARDYYGHTHFVWCADCFDGRGNHLHSGGSYPPSSNPAELYSALRAATLDRRDWHNPSIADWKLKLKQRAVDDVASGTLTIPQGEEIVFLIDHAEFTDWRPLLYVINRVAVEPRLKGVNIGSRASPVMEYQITDLGPAEFDVVEFR